MNKHLEFISREKEIFKTDFDSQEYEIKNEIRNSKFLIVGGAGSIGSAVANAIFSMGALKLDIVDNSENYLVELVRDVRSSFGYITKSFNTYCLDYRHDNFQRFLDNKQYDYVFNFAALKHVRSEQHFETAVSMVEVNVIASHVLLERLPDLNCKKYFCVSTDKATRPANLMGATKRAMELALMQPNSGTATSFARFANVFLSHGSLTENFYTRLRKQQPISLPSDIQRYFILSNEAACLCLLSALIGKENETFIPKVDENFMPISFKEILKKILADSSLEPIWIDNEEEARQAIGKLNLRKFWPVYTFQSNTVGEKHIEEFYTKHCIRDTERFRDIDVILNLSIPTFDILSFKTDFQKIKVNPDSNTETLISLLSDYVTDFEYKKSNRSLNEQM